MLDIALKVASGNVFVAKDLGVTELASEAVADPVCVWIAHSRFFERIAEFDEFVEYFRICSGNNCTGSRAVSEPKSQRIGVENLHLPWIAKRPGYWHPVVPVLPYLQGVDHISGG